MPHELYSMPHCSTFHCIPFLSIDYTTVSHFAPHVTVSNCAPCPIMFQVRLCFLSCCVLCLVVFYVLVCSMSHCAAQCPCFSPEGYEYALKQIEGTGISMSACREIAVNIHLPVLSDVFINGLLRCLLFCCYCL